MPPGRALLIPGGFHHSGYYTASSEVHVAYFKASALQAVPRQSRAFALSCLFRELVDRIVELGWNWQASAHNLRIVELMVDELTAVVPIKTLLPYGRDPRLKKVTDALLLDPGCNRGLEGWAALAATSPRTLARLFLSDTEFTFAQWRKQLRLNFAIQKMADGESVTNVAFELGYASTSSFTTMFTRAMGQPPRAFLESLRRG